MYYWILTVTSSSSLLVKVVFLDNFSELGIKTFILIGIKLHDFISESLNQAGIAKSLFLTYFSLQRKNTSTLEISVN